MAKEESPKAAEADTPEEEKIQVNRREFLNLAWLASLGIITVNVGVVTILFSLPRFEEGEFGGTFTVPPAGIPDVDSGPEVNARGKFWLANTPQGVSALYVVCTHLGCLYGWLDEENLYRCPCHGSQFLKDGTFKAGPAPRSLDQFSIKVVDETTGEVLAETNPETLEPVPVPDVPGVALQVDTGDLLRGKPK